MAVPAFVRRPRKYACTCRPRKQHKPTAEQADTRSACALPAPEVSARAGVRHAALLQCNGCAG
eukprot:8050158-Alexandrium_andersonii.AAC.1